MATDRKVRFVIESTPTLEGAGVHLKRAFGFSEVPQFDPFLLLDDFHSDNPEYYEKGFPWHPHRGIETISYVLQGSVEHGDSMGNEGVIKAGDVQWMTAGSGIIHQEMPKGDENDSLWGFQLWANLPASHKMMQPRYQELNADQFPVIEMQNGVRVKILCGEFYGEKGPVENIVIEPSYMDISVPPETEFIQEVEPAHTAFAYVIDGKCLFCNEEQPFTYNVKGAYSVDVRRKPYIGKESLVFFDHGDRVIVKTQEDSARFLLVAGKPIGEPIAWRGPIVMNTQEELMIAFEDYRNGTFVKSAG